VIVELNETTVTKYAECVTAGACLVPNAGSNYHLLGVEDHPIHTISQPEFRTYAIWRTGRLPTKAEWETAAHGGTGSTYPWGEELPDCTTSVHSDAIEGEGCGAGGTMPVGSVPLGAGPLGHLDMSGNVGEWTDDDTCGGDIMFSNKGGGRSTSNADKLSIPYDDCRMKGEMKNKFGGRIAFDGPPL